jgi:hypothetical protein
MRAKPDGTNAGLIVAPSDGTDTPIGPYTDFKYDATGNLRQMREAVFSALFPRRKPMGYVRRKRWRLPCAA